jgi:ABC-type uncharacterized transport system involved in gliding motility auxiliary subunit
MRPARRLLASFNIAMTLVLLGVLFILINFVSSRHYGRWDVTKAQITALSEQTRQVLAALKEPVSVIVFYQPTHRLYGLVKDLLKEYVRANPRLEVEYVDPEQDLARAKQLAQELAIEDLNLVVLRSGSRHKYLSDVELADYDDAGMTIDAEPRVKAFKGEEAFTAALLGVTQATPPRLWLTGGHGEKSVSSPEPGGLSDLKKYLEQQNMVLEEMNLLQHPTIPADVKLVVIPGPTRRFADAELEALHGYLDRGGSLLALLDPLTDTGLEGLLNRWGILVGNDIVVDPARQLPFVSAANLFVTDYTQHPIVEKMKTLMTLYPLARSIRPAEPSPQDTTVSPLAFTSADGWGETTTGDSTFTFAEGEDLKGPVPIAAAAERLSAVSSTGEQTGQAEVRTRIVAIGDSDFIMNAQLANVGNRDFLLAAVNWLIAQEQLIGIGPKPLETMKLNLTGSELTRIFWLSFLAMPSACGLLGLGVWWLRRR